MHEIGGQAIGFGLVLLAILAGILLNRGDIRDLRSELGAKIDKVRDELRGEINGVRDELRGEIHKVRDELGAKIDNLHGELRELETVGSS